MLNVSNFFCFFPPTFPREAASSPPKLPRPPPPPPSSSALLALDSSASCPTWLWWYEISVPMATSGTRNHLHFPPSNSCPFHLHRNNILGWMSGPLQSQSVSVWELRASYLCSRLPVSAWTFTSWCEWWSWQRRGAGVISLSSGPHFNIAFGHVFLLHSYFIKQSHQQEGNDIINLQGGVPSPPGQWI